MPVKVKFPDGTEREVPSSFRAVATGSGSSLAEVPNECPEWRYIPMAGGWIAAPKRRH